MKKVRIATRQFFSSIWEDFVALLKKHFCRLIGFIIMFLVPIGSLITIYVEKVDNATKWVMPFGVILPIAMIVLIYWGKLRRTLAIKINSMKVENNIEKGKHAGAIIVCDLLSQIMTIAPFVLVYLLIKELEKYSNSIGSIFLFVIVCETVGSVFIVIDTILNVVDYSETEVVENKDN